MSFSSDFWRQSRAISRIWWCTKRTMAIESAEMSDSVDKVSLFCNKEVDQAICQVSEQKMVRPRPLLFSVFSNKHQYNFYSNYVWKNVHVEYRAVIRTHDLWNMSLLP